MYASVSFQAFGSQYVYCCKKLELDTSKVNVNGGAIAIGHPLGATGTFYLSFILLVILLNIDI